MKKLLIAVACLPLLAACNKEVEAPANTSTTAPVAETPVETGASSMPATVPATQDMAPASTAPETTAPAPAATDNMSTSGSSAAGTTEGSGGGMYVVNRGDTLWGIAEKNGISHGDLAKWNNINDPRELQPGRELRLSAP